VQGGNVIMPSFAVGRAQELLYILREVKERRLVPSRFNFKVYLDSPMAIAATKVYQRDMYGYADESTLAMLAAGDDPINFPGLITLQTAEESKALNTDTEPKVVISTGGMCDAGRIRHHLKHNLWRSESTIVFVGFQSSGTLGRRLIDGAKLVHLLGDEIFVKAKIRNFKRLSAHADKDGLLDWISAYEKKPEHVFIVHGELTVAKGFAATLEELGFAAHAPNYQEVYDLIDDVVLSPGIPKEGVALVAGAAAWGRLQAAADQLQELVANKSGSPNIDLNRLTNQILSILQKWK
ncbi:MAG: MBL fold metallo-hydrolase, partial [Symbiobacteriaceae bacterium]|nr:MBL fold metallo-hydrolase [Symbiobacteriaceae bacterium]